MDAEIKVPSVENTELKHSSLIKAWSRSTHSHTCYTYCQEFLADSTLLVHSPAYFFQNVSCVFPVLAVANTHFSAGLQNRIGHPADADSCVECPRNIIINGLQNMFLFFVVCFPKVWIEFELWFEKKTVGLINRLKFVVSPDVILFGDTGLKAPTN